MKSYLDAIEYILKHGEVNTEERTGVGTISVFGDIQLSYDLRNYFPAVTTKKLAWKGVKSELIWFLEGSGDERRLAEILYGKDRSELSNKTTIWTGNAQAEYWKNKAKFDGDLGSVYGVQWRSWQGADGTRHDQIKELIQELRENPKSRRHILSAWNVAELKKMALPPCHVLSQFHVSNNNELSCKMYQRSADFFLGVPFNIASYALFVHIMAKLTDLKVGKLILTFGDAHIYLNHLDAVKEQLKRNPLQPPTLWVNPNIQSIDNLKMEDFDLLNYKSHDTIKAPMAV